MRVIGTAGHVDHGKSTLVKRLTGIDPDRLAEEQAREMTIDLGFAWLTLPDGTTVGIVDVPGHRDFIENMLAGVGGIDAVLLVVATDEGVMPQTREHLAIIDLLSVQNGLIVLTKTDLVDDPEWLRLIEQDLRDVTAGTTLSDAEIVQVSARTGTGLDELVQRLAHLLGNVPERPDYQHPRLPIDRVFTISGFGTVVTGTLLGGTLRVGDDIEVQPTGMRGRIRGLQSYKQSVEAIAPGNRAAVNIVGIDRKTIERGHVLVYPGQLQSTTLADIRFRHLSGAERPLKHNTSVKFFSGTAESVAHVRLLNEETLTPGAEGWLQVRLEKRLALAQGDRFILRHSSPGQTIGGGVVINPHPGRRWRRFQPQVIKQLETQMVGSPAQRVAQAAHGPEPIKRSELQKATGYTGDELNVAMSAALNEGLLQELPDGSLWSTDMWEQLSHRLVEVLANFHQAEPLRQGMPREELRSRLGLKSALLNALLNARPEVVADDSILRLINHQIQFTDAQLISIAQLNQRMADSPFVPPSYSEAVEIVGEEVLASLISSRDIVHVQPDVIFSTSAYAAMVNRVLDMIDTSGNVSASAVRDAFQTSRKYAIGLLEHLDQIGITRRIGDTRVRGNNRSTR
jgi:selenocysteine-specific elongation factor